MSPFVLNQEYKNILIVWYSNVLVQGVFPSMKHPLESITSTFLWTLKDADIENEDMAKNYMTWAFSSVNKMSPSEQNFQKAWFSRDIFI